MNDSSESQWQLIPQLRNIILAGLIANVFFLWVQFDHYPKNTFLITSSQRFSDFTNWLQYQNYPIYHMEAEWGCPPFSLLVATFWKEIAVVTGTVASFCLYSSLCLAFHSRIVFRELSRWGGRPDFSTWAILSFLSYPVLFAFDRGNPAWMVYLSIYGFFYFCRRDKYQMAAFFLAIAISIKIVPVLLLFYLFYKGRWFPAVCVLLETVLLNFIGYFVISHFFYSGYSLDLFFNGLKSYQATYAIGGLGLAFSNSFYSFVLLLVHFCAHIFNFPLVSFKWETTALAFSNIFTVGTMTGICGWAWLRRPKISEYKVSSLLILFLLLVPPVMADYYLLFCYLLLFDLLRLDLDSISFQVYSACLGLIMIPKAYYVFFGDVNLGVFLNPLLLATMLICLICSERKRPRRNDIRLKAMQNRVVILPSVSLTKSDNP